VTTDDGDQELDVSSLTPLRPVYPFGDPGAPIELYSGPISVDSTGPWEGRIFVDLAGDLQVRWSGTKAEGWLTANDVKLTIERPHGAAITVPAHRNLMRIHDLRAFMELFLGAWFDANQHDVTGHVARHLIVAHHSGTTIEAKIMLVHAALEYLFWVTYVLGPLRRSEGHHDRKDKFTGAVAATWHLQELLCDVKIDTAIPAGLVAMTKRAQEMQPFARANQVIDGPEVLTWLRGRLVHPKDAGEPYGSEDLITEAWRLVTEYGDLLLLHRIGYEGKYRPRTVTSPWVNSVPVPWAI
jgi:hypothetical protein